MSASREMPKYQCHKKVWALKIKQINKLTMSQRGLVSDPQAEDGRLWEIVPENDQYAPFDVKESYISKHQPVEGGYYVVYEDGYASFSPADAFEGGYALIN